MLLQLTRGNTAILILAKGVFVNDGVVAGAVEEGGGDPGFKHEPL